MFVTLRLQVEECFTDGKKLPQRQDEKIFRDFGSKEILNFLRSMLNLLFGSICCVEIDDEAHGKDSIKTTSLYFYKISKLSKLTLIPGTIPGDFSFR